MMIKKIIIVLAACSIALSCASVACAVDLPMEVQADRYLLSGMKKYKSRDFREARADFDKVAELQVKVRDDFYYYYASALEQTGNLNKGREMVKMYLARTGIGGEFYRDSLELLVSLEENIKRHGEDAALVTKVAQAVAGFKMNLPKKRKPQPPIVEPLTGMELVRVDDGCFEMGDKSLAGPVHTVCLNGFYMGRHEVTQKQWKIIMGSNPARFNDCPTCPVENVSFEAVALYIDKLNRKSGRNYRLPTEAQWEYAARSGGKAQSFAGRGEVDELAWYNANSKDKTHPVGKKKPNDLGLYDMSGNVWEWCGDWFDEGYYGVSPVVNPTGPAEGDARVVRGGSWYLWHQFARTTNRHKYIPTYHYGYLGFRLVLAESPAGE